MTDCALAMLAVLYTAGAFLLSRHASYYDVYRISGRDSVSFERAQVLSVNSEQLEQHPHQRGLVTGTQDITVRILSGTEKGRMMHIVNYLNYDTSFKVHAGSRIIVSVNKTASGRTIHVYVNSPERIVPLAAFALLIAVLFCVTGGRQGYHSLLALVFAVVNVMFVFVPIVCRGMQPAPAALFLAAATACVTLPLAGGLGRKTAAAIIGTLVCLCVSAAAQAVFCPLASVSGFTMGSTDSLMQIAAHSGLQIGGLLFSAVLISSLGAVMDISMSVASALQELHENNPAAGRRQLFRAGMHMGRDMTGTMASTLILAFAGTALVPLIQIYTYNMCMNQVLNSDEITAELVQSLTGSFAVICAVPVVSAVSAWLFTSP